MQPSPSKENLAGILARAFITSKLTFVFIVAVTIAGFIAIAQTPREENPQVIMPAAQVTVTMPGASAAEIEELIVTPLEGLLSGISGVDYTESTAMNSVGIVAVTFKVGQPKEASLVKVNDRVTSNRHLLPTDALTPIVRGIDSDDVPIVTLTLASDSLDDYALKRLADHVADRLRSTKDVSLVTVHGGRTREISIEIDPMHAQTYNLSMTQVYGAINASNLTVPMKSIVRDGKVEAIKLTGAFTSVEEIRNQIVAYQDDRPVYIRDIATVRDGPTEERDKVSRFSFGPADKRLAETTINDMAAVTIAVAKKKNTNAVVVSDAIIERVEKMRTSTFPDDVHVVVTRNDGAKANDAVNLLIEHLGIAIVTVSFVLLLFLGWREALIVTVTVPLVLALTLGADMLGNVTINRVTLFALILSLGLLVDAAIVVIENIHRHYRDARQGADKREVTILATNEIGNATNLATLAVMLVFGSLLTVTGMAGDYFYPVSYNVPIAMAASIVVAYIVTPWAALRWVKWHPRQQKDSTSEDENGKRLGWLERGYLFFYTPLQNSGFLKVALLVTILLLMTGSLMQGAWQFVRPEGITGPQSAFGVNVGFMMKNNNNTFNIVLYMPENTPLEETDKLAREIGALLDDHPHVKDFQTWIGQAGVPDFNGLFKGTAQRAGSHVGEIRVNLRHKHDRKTSSIEIVQKLREQTDAIRARYPGARISLNEDPPGLPVRSTILAEIYGPDAEGRRALSEQVQQIFANSYDTVDQVNTEPMDIHENRIVPDKDKAAMSLVSTADINQVLSVTYGGTVLGRAHLSDEKNPVPIRTFVPQSYMINPDQLDRLVVNNQRGEQVPLSELVTIVSSTKDRTILHKDNEPVTFVGTELASAVPLYSVIDLNRKLDGIIAPDGRPLRTGNLTFQREAPDTIDGYLLLWSGEMRITLDIYRDMGIALAVALSVVFLMLVAYYKSFAIPVIAMSAVPLGIIGIFPGHWLIGADFSATSMVGIIALAGVVIRNSLLIIDFIQDKVKSGLPLARATCEAGAIRLRPILLTTFAIVLGTAIMLTDPVFGGLAISLIFGTIISTILTVFVVPVLYYLYARRIS